MNGLWARRLLKLGVHPRPARLIAGVLDQQAFPDGQVEGEAQGRVDLADVYLFNGRTGLTSLNMTGLDPSALKDFFYTFANCGNLVTILVDSTWALASGASGMGTFYNCRSIVGGNGTTYSSSAYGYARAVIDRAGQAGT